MEQFAKRWIVEKIDDNTVKISYLPKDLSYLVKLNKYYYLYPCDIGYVPQKSFIGYRNTIKAGGYSLRWHLMQHFWPKVKSDAYKHFKIETWHRNKIAKKMENVAFQVEQLLIPQDSELRQFIRKFRSVFHKNIGLLSSYGNDIYIDAIDKYSIKDCIKYRAAMRLLSSGLDLSKWRSHYYPNPTKNINKILDNFPGGIPNSLGVYLPMWINTLNKDKLTRMELLSILNLNNQKFYPDKEIKKAFKIYKRLNNLPSINMRKFETVRLFLQNTNDYIRMHNVGNRSLENIIIDSYRWHNIPRTNVRQDNQLGYRYALDPRFRLETPTAIPPWKIEHVNIKFLSTYKDLAEESKLMNHCVQTYIDRAVKGISYLYHIDYENEMATVEVDSTGNIVQSQGPGNLPNKASKWGEQEIRKCISQQGQLLAQRYSSLVDVDGVFLNNVYNPNTLANLQLVQF